MAPASVSSIDKWSLFRDLCTARTCFGISDRDLVVLNALLTFLPGKLLEDGSDLIVFPSNKSLSERAHGMPESTLRRHLAALVGSGLITRHDSPNGKRYARRGRGGQMVTAFGFSLRPLLVQAERIADSAQTVQDTAEALLTTRERAVLLLRDAAKLAEYGDGQGFPGPWDSYLDEVVIHRRTLRRKLTLAEMQALVRALEALNNAVSRSLTTHEPCGEVAADTPEMSGKPVHSERHYQSSQTDLTESEPCAKKTPSPFVDGSVSTTCSPANDPPIERCTDLPLALVLDACSDMEDYGEPVRNWSDFVRRAGFIRGMLGISPDAWEKACSVMGPPAAAISVGYILQNVTKIKAPGGYLRALIGKAGEKGFSPAPMVFALLNQGAKS